MGGRWQVTSISKDDPNTVVICRNHNVTEIIWSCVFLSANDTEAPLRESSSKPPSHIRTPFNRGALRKVKRRCNASETVCGGEGIMLGSLYSFQVVWIQLQIHVLFDIPNTDIVPLKAWLGSHHQPLEIQITNGNGQTAIVFLDQEVGWGARLNIHGQIEGARHRFGWKANGRRYGMVSLKMSIHVTGHGVIRLTPDASQFSFITTNEVELAFPKLEFKIPMFTKGEEPPSYEASTATS